MGLDLTAYAGMKKLDVACNSDGEPIDPATGKEMDWHDYVHVLVNTDFPGRANEFEDGAFYSYEYSDSGELHWSYGGYNEWREWLARFAGWPTTPYLRFGKVEELHAATAWETEDGGPFWELICFSDCEGVLGSAVCRKLADEFAAHYPRLVEQYNRGWHKGWSLSSYRGLWWACELAANGGCIVFH